MVSNDLLAFVCGVGGTAVLSAVVVIVRMCSISGTLDPYAGLVVAGAVSLLLNRAVGVIIHLHVGMLMTCVLF